MTAKEYLNSIRYLQNTIRTLEKELQYWKNLAETISRNTLDPRYNPNRNTAASFEKCMEKYDEIQRELAEKVRELVEIRDSINDRIEQISDPEERILLHYRYLNRYTWEELCAVMGISRRTAFRIHGRALREIDEKI